MLNGILILDKPEDFTSHDAVAKLRGILHQKKIGHAGTLDPMATGVLVVLLGSATRASDHASGQKKQYAARLRLGLTTDTQDTTGRTIEERETEVSREQLAEILPEFTGKQLQLPPMYSAVQVNGKRLYALARKGVEVEREAREIEIPRLELLPLTDHTPEHCFDLLVECSKGTYIRTLCNDIGERLGCGGCMAALRRVRSGRFTEEDALSFDEVRALFDGGTLQEHLFPIESVYEDLPRVTLNADGDVRASHGAFFLPEHLSEGGFPPEGECCRVYDSRGVFCQIGMTGELDRGGQAIFCRTNFANKE